MAVVFTLPTPLLASFGTGIENGDDLNKAIGQPLEATYTGLTALSGGGTTGATPLLYAYNVVSTTAATNDSVKLPAAKIGGRVTVTNGGTSTMAVYAQTADTINGGSAGGSTTQATLVTNIYRCGVAGAWWKQ